MLSTTPSCSEKNCICGFTTYQPHDRPSFEAGCLQCKSNVGISWHFGSHYIRFLAHTKENKSDEEKALRNEFSLVYCTPEKVIGMIEQLKILENNICLFAIDEAHCVSEWGHDFRPEYRKLSLLRQTFPSVPIMALTGWLKLPLPKIYLS